MKKTIWLIFLFSIALAILVSGNENIWLSNSPPSKVADKVKKTGMRRLPVVFGKERQMNIIQWIRTGELPENSKYAEPNNLLNAKLFVFDPDGKSVSGEMVENELGFIVSFVGDKDGFYSIYLVEKYVRNDTLNIHVAKAERMNHSCRKGHDKGLIRVLPKIYPQQIPIEIVRERFSGENLHTVLEPGDEVTFKILINNTELNRENIQMVTQRGWRNSKTTNNNGEVTFQFIQDDNTKFKELRNRITFNYLINFTHTVVESGIINGEQYSFITYSSSFSDTYRPSQMLYSSFVWALFVLLGSILLLTIGIYYYRRRRRVEYREVV